MYMEKVINFELAKKLDEAWVMKDIETEYCYFKWTYIAWDNKEYVCDKLQIIKYFNWIKEKISNQYEIDYDDFNILIIKAPTLSEAIDILPKRIDDEHNAYYLTIVKWENLFYICYNNESEENIITTINNNFIYWKTLLEAVEKMLEWLIENNLRSIKRYYKRFLNVW